MTAEVHSMCKTELLCSSDELMYVEYFTMLIENTVKIVQGTLSFTSILYFMAFSSLA